MDRSCPLQDALLVLRAELWSHFWPNCDCRDLGHFFGVLAELIEFWRAVASRSMNPVADDRIVVVTLYLGIVPLL